MTATSLTLLADTNIAGASPDANTGTSIASTVGRNGTGTAPRRHLQRWQSYSAAGIPSNAIIVSDIISLNVTAKTNTTTPNLTINRMNGAAWIEGDTNIGATWKDYNFDGVTSAAHPWTTGAFSGAPANQGGDCIATNQVTAPMPNAIAVATFDIATLSQVLVTNSYPNELEWVCDGDHTTIAACTFTFETRDGTIIPTRVVTWTLPVQASSGGSSSRILPNIPNLGQRRK